MTDVWFVYLVRCGDGTIYCGIARDVEARIEQHRNGKGARYTRGRGPFTLLAKRRCGTKGAALRLEIFLKRLATDRKAALAGSPHELGAFARKVSGARRRRR
jgi:putative endonuclease